MSPRVREDSVHPRLQSDASARPLNFCVRHVSRRSLLRWLWAFIGVPVTCAATGSLAASIWDRYPSTVIPLLAFILVFVLCIGAGLDALRPFVRADAGRYWKVGISTAYIVGMTIVSLAVALIAAHNVSG
jgi:hypothetical protein